MKQVLYCVASACVLTAVVLTYPWPAFANSALAFCPSPDPNKPNTFTLAEDFESETSVETVLCTLPVNKAPTKDLNFDLKHSNGTVSDYLDIFSKTADIPGLVRFGSDPPGGGLTSRNFATPVDEVGSEGSDGATISFSNGSLQDTTIVAQSDVLPEPSTIALMLTGVGPFALGYLRRRMGAKSRPAV